jgi:flagellar protein FliS
MQNLAKQNYLQAEVHTATPQKLQLMLVEAAIKNIHRTKKAWEEEKFEAGLDSLSLAQDIIAAILSSLDREGSPDLAGKIASIYVFVLRCLAEGGMTHDPVKLDDALRVLSSERETWKQVCEKFGSAIVNPDSSGAGSGSSVSSSARLDLSADSSAKVLTSPKSSGISTATFAKPSGFSSGVKPLGATEPAKKDATSSGMSWDG